MSKRLPFGIYVVKGNSMLPVLRPGTLLLGSKWWVKPKPGHIVVIQKDRHYIKRIKRASPRGFWVEGDNVKASTDSRQFGWVGRQEIEAVVFMRLFK